MNRVFKIIVPLLLALVAIVFCTTVINNVGSLSTLVAIVEPTATPTVFLFDGVGTRKIRVVQPSPAEFVGGVVVRTGRMIFAEEMCTPLNMRNLWRPGDTAETLHAHFASDENVHIEVNNALYSVANGKAYWESGLTWYYIYDDIQPIPLGTPEIVGSYSDLTYCLNTEDLGIGLYNVNVTLRIPLGTRYSSSWEFEIYEIALNTSTGETTDTS